MYIEKTTRKMFSFFLRERRDGNTRINGIALAIIRKVNAVDHEYTG
jgi:light-regulated signal transduction histidine kinase (bacteriophytochrome)